MKKSNFMQHTIGQPRKLLMACASLSNYWGWCMGRWQTCILSSRNGPEQSRCIRRIKLFPVQFWVEMFWISSHEMTCAHWDGWWYRHDGADDRICPGGFGPTGRIVTQLLRMWRKILFVHTFVVSLQNMHGARQYTYRALCKVLRWLDDWNWCDGRKRIREIWVFV